MDNKNNNDPNRLITVAIHTFDHALNLKNTLEEEGIEVVLHNVNLDEKVLAARPSPSAADYRVARDLNERPQLCAAAR